MNTTLAKTLAYCGGALLACMAITAHAQTANQAGALSLFVNDPTSNATDLQRQTGYAVQGMCVSLGAEGGLRLTGAKGDLYQRCNEMVETARVFQGIPPGTGRTLGYTDRADLLVAVQQVSGEELAAQGTMSTQVSAGQFANIGGRLNALRMGGAAAASRGHVAFLQDSTAPALAMTQGMYQGRLKLFADTESERSSPDADVSRLGWFLESSYGFGDHDQTASEDGFDYDSFSASAGTDYNFGSSVIGFAVGYDQYTADFDDALLVTGGEVEVSGMSGSLFGGFFGTGWSLNGIATYGQLESDVTRQVIYNSANAACSPSCGTSRSIKGSPDGSYIALGVTLGYEFDAGGWDFVPSLSASYRDVDIDGYDEIDSLPAGGLALRYEDQTIESTRSIVGLAMSKPISRSYGVLTPSLRLEWHHEFEDDPRAVRAKYVQEDSLVANASAAKDFACPISCFTMLTDPADGDFGLASLGLSATFAQRMQFYIFYEALLGAANLTGNSIAVGLRGQF
jgi:outer membrane lipase/esterase